jgi:hypothetical protein
MKRVALGAAISTPPGLRCGSARDPACGVLFTVKLAMKKGGRIAAAALIMSAGVEDA